MERTKIQFAASNILATLRVLPARAFLMPRRTGFQIGILGIWFFLSSFVYAGPHRFLFDETYASTEAPVALSKEAKVADVAMPAENSMTDGLLDLYPDALAAYSLRKLRSSYTGPAIRVKRMSDGSQRDFSFVGDDLDTAGIEAWLAGSDGAVVKWYSQMAGHPAMVPGNAEGPLIAQNGSVLVDDQGHPEMRTGIGNHWGLYTESNLPTPLSNGNASVFMVLETDGPTNGSATILSFSNAGSWPHYDFEIKTNGQNKYWFSGPGTNDFWGDRTRLPISWDKNAVIAVLDGNASKFKVYQNDERIIGGGTEFEALVDQRNFFVGLHSKYLNTGAEIKFSEVVIYEALSTDQEVWNRYDNINGYWQVGPTGTNRDAILPQQYQYQVDLYNWLETFSVDDLVLPVLPFTWNGSGLSDDEIADIWLQLEGATASSVVRGEPDWYVLDADNGKGIEATGEVRIWHEPRDGNYEGNPARSWSNEPAFLYQLDIPLSGGSQGNPYFQHPVLCHRAMIVTAVDLMMYHQTMASGGYAEWGDMYGKALLGWAEAYRWCKPSIPVSVQQAFENGFEYFLDQMITVGPRAVNTNMDMFAIQGAADLYMAVADPLVRQKTVQAVKRSLFGYTDGELGVRHKVFKARSEDNGGVFDPSGFIMEGDQPDIFYGGESIYHLAGALAAVTDRETGHVENDWAFLEEVVRRAQEWRTYQYFYDLGVASPHVGGIRQRTLPTAGAGFSGRTSVGVPDGQANETWKFNFLADIFSDARYLMDLESIGEMETSIQGKMTYLNTKLSSVYVATPPTWNGWSPWTKKTPYLPPRGWYSRLRNLQDSNDPSIRPPVRQSTYYNKAFGGYPTGYEYWAYKGSDGTRDWGFFLEAQAKQGGYGGWYGGKIETFWTSTTGVIVLNRHGKTGCDGGNEDSTCWDNLDSKAAQHVWGRDENGKGFTTLLLRGQELQREAAFEISGPTPTVSINNVFNDPSLSPTVSETGEQTGHEIEGSFEVINTFEAHSNGVKVIHHVLSDGLDDVTELWASLPIYLRMYAPDNPGDQLQMLLDDTSIEFWTGSLWESLPEDTNGDGRPELVSTSSLRLGRDYLLGDGMQYAYVAFEQSQSVRLSDQIYTDPYQTKSRVRTVHIDLHGSPGSVRSMPTNHTLQYTIQTTDPTAPSPNLNHNINLFEGWNLTSTYVSPDEPGMEDIFANTDVVLVKDQAGQAFIPEFGINDIGDWNPLQAYMVYAPLAETLTIEGEALAPESSPISLAADWNFVSYLRGTPMPIEDALQTINADITLVTNRAGETYIPDFGINNIGSMNPGEGYKIYMEQSAVLTYPSNTTQAAKGGVVAANYETHTSLPGIPASMLLLVEGSSLEEGREIIAKTSEGREVGRGSVRRGRATITVQGDESLTPDIVEGAGAGEGLFLEISMGASEGSQVLDIVSLRDALKNQMLAGEMHYAEDAFFVAKVDDVPHQFSLGQNYPNPFNPSTTLSYNLPSEVQVVLEVYNLLGQRVAMVVNDRQEAGRYQVPFEASDMASGTYFYRLQAGSFQATRKMLLMK